MLLHVANRAILYFDLSLCFVSSEISKFFSFLIIELIYDRASILDSLFFAFLSSCRAFNIVSSLFGNSFFPKSIASLSVLYIWIFSFFVRYKKVIQ